MYYSTGIKDRVEFITALYDLARFLDIHPDVPVPLFGDQITLNADSFDNGGKAQVDHIARLLGAAITDDTTNGGHYRAVRQFGPLSYEAVAIPEACIARYDAEHSYRGCVTPDTPADSDLALFDEDATRRTDPYSLTDCGDPDCSRQHPCDDCHAAINRASVRATQEAWWL
jgi:hypothetical protein